MVKVWMNPTCLSESCWSPYGILRMLNQDNPSRSRCSCFFLPLPGSARGHPDHYYHSYQIYDCYLSLNCLLCVVFASSLFLARRAGPQINHTISISISISIPISISISISISIPICISMYPQINHTGFLGAFDFLYLPIGARQRLACACPQTCT